MEISVQEAQSLLKNQDLRLVDCREEDEYAICHLPAAELIPLSNFRTEAPRQLTDKNQQIIVYCHHGMRSLKAAHFLQQLGYSNVRSLRGGIDLWSSEIDPSVPRY